MFTIKWVYKTARGEITHMYQSEQVDIAYKNSLPPGTPEPSAPWKVQGRIVEKSLAILDGHGIFGRSFNCGMIYVMNDQGATVGKYILDDKVLPESVTLSETPQDGLNWP